MRTGDYKPSRPSVDVQLFSHGGVDQSSNAKLEQANSLADEYDKSFSKIVSEEIANYRSVKNGWQTPGPARSSYSTRPAGPQPLTEGQSGEVTGHVVANSDGGTARPGRWTGRRRERHDHSGQRPRRDASIRLDRHEYRGGHQAPGQIRGDLDGGRRERRVDAADEAPPRRRGIVGTFSGSLDWTERRAGALVVERQRDIRSAQHQPARRKRALSAGRGLGHLHDDLHRGGPPLQRAGKRYEAAHRWRWRLVGNDLCGRWARRHTSTPAPSPSSPSRGKWLSRSPLPDPTTTGKPSSSTSHRRSGPALQTAKPPRRTASSTPARGQLRAFQRPGGVALGLSRPDDVAAVLRDRHRPVCPISA